jgi:hypothetical protein
LLTSTQVSVKGLGYFKRYSPAAFLLPINVLEDFIKPYLYLSDYLETFLLMSLLLVLLLVPLVIPTIMLLGLFTSGIQH